jgi:hypothetical protein
MRIRSTKPEFWSSRTVCEVEWEHRFILKGLESYVDDNGVGKDDLELICGDVWKRDLAREGSRTLARVSAALDALHQAGLIWRYEVDGEPLLFISCWESIQKIDRPSAGRFPRPDGTWNFKESVIRECVASPREPSRALDAGTGEQGNRGTGEQSSSSEIASDLDATTGIDDEPRPEVVELCEHLAAKVRTNGHTAKVGKLWHRECRLLIDVDGHTPEQIRKAIDWATADPFWSANIRSMRTLREKYTTLRAQAAKRPTSPASPEPREPRYVPSYHGDPDDLDAYQRWYGTDHADPAAVAEYHRWYAIRHPEAS